MNVDFDKIKKYVTDGAAKIKEVSGNLVEITKLKHKLSEVNNEINDCYMRIGKLVCESDENADCEEAIAALCTKVSELKENAQQLTDSIDDALNKKTCSECGFRYEKDYSYCPKCGNAEK